MCKASVRGCWRSLAALCPPGGARLAAWQPLTELHPSDRPASASGGKQCRTSVTPPNETHTCTRFPRKHFRALGEDASATRRWMKTLNTHFHNMDIIISTRLYKLTNSTTHCSLLPRSQVPSTRLLLKLSNKPVPTGESTLHKWAMSSQ